MIINIVDIIMRKIVDRVFVMVNDVFMYMVII